MESSIICHADLFVEVSFVWESRCLFDILRVHACGETCLGQSFLYVWGDVERELEIGVIVVVVVCP